MDSSDNPGLQRRREIDRLFVEALDLPKHERDAFLAEICGDDPVLRDEVQVLLDAESRSEGLFEGPAPIFVRKALSDYEDHATDILSTPEHAGVYRIVRKIGRGGMGTVYLGERIAEDFEQRVAVKLLRRGLDTDDIVRRFVGERRILAGLDHPNIARLLDGGSTDDGRPFLVMEYVEGKPITDYCEQSFLTVHQRLALFLQVCKAVSHAHTKLVVHRDLKPSNILVTADGVVKLLDFGIAKILGADEEGLTRSGVRVLTPEYASPEQLRGDPATTVSDVYLLGALLYRLLTGSRMRHRTGATPSQGIHVILDSEPVLPSAAVAEKGIGGVPRERVRTQLQGDLDTMILKALQAEPDKRYGSVAELAEDVRRHLDGRPVSARPDSLRYRTEKFVRRNPVAVALAATILLGLVSAVAGLSVHSYRLQVEQNRTKLANERAETITGFLVGLFEGANPSGAYGAEMTTRDLLARGTREADGLSGQPELKGDLLNVLAQVHGAIGNYAEAERLAREALTIRRDLFGEDHEEVAESLTSLAAILSAGRDPAAADSLAREALRIRRAELGPMHPDIAETLNVLARTLEINGEYEEAELLFQEALAMRRSTLGEGHAEVASSLNNLGSLATNRGNFTDADSLYREALAIRRATLGEQHPYVASTLNNLAVVQDRLGRYDEAAALYGESVSIRRSALGDHHPDLARGLSNFGLFLFRRMRDYDAAEPLLHEALAMRREIYGNEHPEVAQTLNNLGGLFLEQQRPADAEPWFREALEINRAAFGARHPNVGFNLNNLGRTLHALGDHAAAEAFLQEAVDLRLEALGPGHPHLAVSLHNLGLLMADRGASAEARALFERALAIRLEALGPDHPDVAASRNALAELEPQT